MSQSYLCLGGPHDGKRLAHDGTVYRVVIAPDPQTTQPYPGQCPVRDVGITREYHLQMRGDVPVWVFQ
jgi:hypothetical protein